MFAKRMLICLLTLWVLPTLADGIGQAVAPDVLVSTMKKAFPDITSVSDIQSSPVPGIVEVEINKSDRAYLTQDGKFMFVGTLYQLGGSQGAVNLTEQRLAGVRAVALRKIKAGDMVTFPATGQQRAQVYVFTDVTCPYCKRFHQGIKEINKLGITVHYLAFPRAGLDNSVATEMGRVWCAKDAQAALTVAKLGKAVNPPQRAGCLSPVADEYNLGIQLGVRGTPSIITTAGDEIGGYMPPAALAKKLGLKGAS